MGNRRRHAQTISCHDCGPQLCWKARGDEGAVVYREKEEALEEALSVLQRGGVIALKGIGGYQFSCRPDNADSVDRLRQLKHRDKKPFAVMFPSMESIREVCMVSEQEEALLLSPARPIVLLNLKKGRYGFASGVSGESRFLGAFLPYTGLHQMLTEAAGPLVMTSGNVTDEPILTSDEDDKDTLIHDIAAKNNMAVYVTNTDGNEICSAEYIVNSRLADMPSEQVQYYYEQAKEHGGIFKIEYEGGINPEFWSEDMPEPEDVAYGPGFHGFLQKRGQEHIKSVIYVKIVECDGQEEILLVNTQLTPVDATVNTLRIELIWITVIMILLSLGIALLISRQISKSLIRINESAKALAKGDFDVRFEGKDYREVAELSDTLNATAKELGKNESLRRELIANVSHDLRTPLTMIIAYAEVMRDLPGENTPENVQVVIDEAGRLTNLVNDMLDMSKLQAGVMEKNDTVYNLTESIESVLERYNKLKEQDGYCIHFEYDGKVQVKADEYKIYQVIYNLINNAINYTGKDKTVWVRQKISGDKVRIEVTDSGDGIAKEALPYVWDRYYKVDKTHKRAVMGTGLGLSIVKEIINAHKQNINVISTVGVGTEFIFTLEKAK